MRDVRVVCDVRRVCARCVCCVLCVRALAHLTHFPVLRIFVKFFVVPIPFDHNHHNFVLCPLGFQELSNLNQHTFQCGAAHHRVAHVHLAVPQPDAQVQPPDPHFQLFSNPKQLTTSNWFRERQSDAPHAREVGKWLWQEGRKCMGWEVVWVGRGRVVGGGESELCDAQVRVDAFHPVVHFHLSSPCFAVLARRRLS